MKVMVRGWRGIHMRGGRRPVLETRVPAPGEGVPERRLAQAVRLIVEMRIGISSEVGGR